MKRLVKFPSINQFRNVVKTVKERANYHSVNLPKLKFTGSVKLHGTNSAVAFDPYDGDFWCQSRENIITPEADNAGFARFVHENKTIFMKVINAVAGIYGNNNLHPGDTVVVYGEWCGQGIQKGVAINKLPKMFVIFGARIVEPEHPDLETPCTWLTKEQLVQLSQVIKSELPEDSMIFSIQDFKTWEIEVDFANPEQQINPMNEITQSVEDCCPVGKAFGIEGIGEGVVWVCNEPWLVNGKNQNDGFIFKVKGPKHSETKVKTQANVDIEKINSIKALAESLITDHRLDKNLDKMMNEDHLPFEMTSISVFLKNVGNDVIKEDSDVIEGNGFTRKEVMSTVNSIARQWYIRKFNEGIIKMDDKPLQPPEKIVQSILAFREELLNVAKTTGVMSEALLKINSCLYSEYKLR